MRIGAKQNIPNKYVTKEELKSQFYGFELKMDEKLVEQRKEFERYTGALAESVRHDIKAIGEGISLVFEMLSRFSEENAQAHEKFKLKLQYLESKVF